MTTQDIAEAVKFNAFDIALEIKTAEKFMKSDERTTTKEIAKAVTYDRITEILFGEGE